MKTAIMMAAATAALGLAGAAHAVAPADKAQPAAPLVAKLPSAKTQPSCFFTRDWSGWRSPNANTIYLRVNVRDIWQIDLSGGSSLLAWPDSHLINEVRGPDSVCGPIDLDLKVANDHFVEPLFVKAVTKLTPDQVAAIPKKFLP
ncbi:MAG TPA: hypothetical protein VGM25_17840 [Caulobacteraceae bacterium]